MNLWEQIGTDLDGKAAGDQSGNSVSISGDGTIVAVGAYGNDDNGNIAQGLTRIYKYSSGSWDQLGNDIYGDNFQTIDPTDYHFIQTGIVNLSSDGTVVAGGGNYLGDKVRIYKYSSGSWNQLGMILSNKKTNRKII